MHCYKEEVNFSFLPQNLILKVGCLFIMKPLSTQIGNGNSSRWPVIYSKTFTLEVELIPTALAFQFKKSVIGV